MIKETTEFIVDGWAAGESGLFTVIGRCGDEPIRVGDTFDAVFRYQPRRYPDELGREPAREEERPARLVVSRIEAYQRSLATLGQGMTGTLVLAGDGIEHVHPGWVLGKHAISASTQQNGYHEPH